MAITSNHVQNNPNQSRSLNTNSARRTYRTSGGTLSLREGETLKGVVSDIHGNEITISMEDGTSFTGRLPEASQYSIGQKAAFLITSLEGGTIYMKAISQAYLLGMEDTIEQALEEAGLPKSPRNLDIVRSLLENHQSISRENIADSLQLCAKYPNADVSTVISMKRLGMSMDSATVTQFDNYRNQSHQLLYSMNSLTDSVGELLQELADENPSIARYAAGEVLNIALDSVLSLEEFNLAAQKAEAQLAEDVMTGNPVEAGELSEIDKVSHPSDATEISNSAGEDTASPFARMRQLLSGVTDRVQNSLAGSAEGRSTEETSPHSPLIPEQTGILLSTEGRSELSELLGKYTENSSLLSSLKDGTLTARELLSGIHTMLSDFSDEDLKTLLHARDFQKAVKGQLMSGWTLSPEGLKEDNGVDRIYHKMNEQLTELVNFSRMFATRTPGETLIHTASDMQQNMAFMKMLNEQFAYMQLPMKLSSENAHGDLYVMTKKNALKKSRDNLKVLLHLEMDSLGTLDIHITKDHTNISTQFYVAKDSARKLLEKNAELLRDAINEQGYSFTSEFLAKEKDIDLVQDFMEQESASPVGNMKRYNFDLRA